MSRVVGEFTLVVLACIGAFHVGTWAAELLKWLLTGA